jgi:hypothetical protein
VSTIKTDAITAVSTNADLSLDGLGTGGVSIASTLKMTKGGDIASASPLVIDTDGNYFDVTGTTNFSAMTVESGNFFMLQFDGALTITHGSGIELPGAANLTTATGDRLMCYATAANTVEVMSVETEAASAAGFTLATEQATTSGTSVTFGSIPAGTKMIVVMFESVSFSGTNGPIVQIGDSGGLETSGYESSGIRLLDNTTPDGSSRTDGFDLRTANAAWHINGNMILTLKDSANFTWTENYSSGGGTSGLVQSSVGGGSKTLSAELTQVKILPHASDTFDNGSINIMYM